MVSAASQHKGCVLEFTRASCVSLASATIKKHRVRVSYPRFIDVIRMINCPPGVIFRWTSPIVEGCKSLIKDFDLLELLMDNL